jgi:hypothetical protein
VNYADSSSGLENVMTKAPFEVGDRIDQNELATWVYTGLSGKPGVDKHAVRRFKKGMWVLEVRAHVRPEKPSRVVAIRSADEDELFWSETRDRLMRHKRRK